MQTVDSGSILAVIIGMAFVVLGLLQYLSGMSQRADKKRTELFDELEREKLENVKLVAECDKWKLKYADLRDYTDRLENYARKLKVRVELIQKSLDECNDTAAQKIDSNS